MKPVMKRLHSNLLQQDCYVRECCDLSHLAPSEHPRQKYLSIEEKVTTCDDGTPCLRHEFVEHDYEITPESVRSYADSCDYTSNPELIGSVPKSGYSDVRYLQSLGDFSLEDFRTLRQRLDDTISRLSVVSEKTQKEKEGEKDE